MTSNYVVNADGTDSLSPTRQLGDLSTCLNGVSIGQNCTLSANTYHLLQAMQKILSPPSKAILELKRDPGGYEDLSMQDLSSRNRFSYLVSTITSKRDIENTYYDQNISKITDELMEVCQISHMERGHDEPTACLHANSFERSSGIWRSQTC